MTSERSETTGEKVPRVYTAPVILYNLSIPKAIRLYGVEAVSSIMKEMHQLQDKGVNTHKVWEYRRQINNNKESSIPQEKKRGTLKARLVADGRMQDKSHHTSQDNSSPTVGTESLFLMAADGTIKAAKVWYDTLSTNLLSGGFKANTFDPCVFNKDFKGDQLTILLYVDDLMISCVNRQGIDYI